MYIPTYNKQTQYVVVNIVNRYFVVYEFRIEIREKITSFKLPDTCKTRR